MGDFDGVGTLN